MLPLNSQKALFSGEEAKCNKICFKYFFTD